VVRCSVEVGGFLDGGFEGCAFGVILEFAEGESFEWWGQVVGVEDLGALCGDDVEVVGGGLVWFL